MVLETQRGVSNAKSANGLKCTNTNVSRESLQPLALVATSVQVYVWLFTLLKFVLNLYKYDSYYL